ncbi:YkyA family protein [Alkalicoccus urumqiensis]|uniref:YkyA family protein n=1 Tax=Alkalicoccus urumqiensis TaxID=1548213 RepID=UPI0015E62875|nr:YkyA family protein [Alkalicoccus urumqiensis]
MKSLHILAGGLFVTLLAGCSGENAAQNVFDEWEEAVAAEQDAEEVQQPLSEQETQETELYNEMLEISEVEDIAPLSEEAVSSAEERRSLMDQEREIIQSSYEQFQEAEDAVAELDEELQSSAESVQNAMDERFSAYETLYEQYIASIDEDQRLYQMVADEEVEVEELQAQHEAVNASYDEVENANETFNEATETFNQEKLSFYEEAELNVAVSEEE